jgi:hypothetical protein
VPRTHDRRVRRGARCWRRSAARRGRWRSSSSTGRSRRQVCACVRVVVCVCHAQACVCMVCWQVCGCVLRCVAQLLIGGGSGARHAC